LFDIPTRIVRRGMGKLVGKNRRRMVSVVDVAVGELNRRGSLISRRIIKTAEGHTGRTIDLLPWDQLQRDVFGGRCGAKPGPEAGYTM